MINATEPVRRVFEVTGLTESLGMPNPAEPPTLLGELCAAWAATSGGEALRPTRTRRPRWSIAGEPGPDGRVRDYAEGYAAGALVSYLADKAGELRSLALRIELARESEHRLG